MDEKIQVSALIVVKNEREFIERALLSLALQKYPGHLYEIIVVDGGSNDGTLSIIEKVRDEKIIPRGIRFSLLENPKGILASGWNIGLKAAQGEYVFRIDAHSIVGEHYIEQCLARFEEIEAACVGGTMQSVAISEKGRYLSSVLSSPFGVGNSKFRYSQEAGYVDTVAFGMYEKKIFDEVGYFDESLKRNQDIELHSRIRKTGAKFYLDPSIEVTYFTRNTLKKMIIQGYENGKWNFILAKKTPAALSLRHTIPFLFSIFLFSWGLTEWAGIKLRRIGRGTAALYLSLAVFFSWKKEKTIEAVVKMPALFLLLHLSYGIGSISGIITRAEKSDEYI